MGGVVEDGVGGFHEDIVGAGVFAGVEVAVEAGEVAAAHFQANPVAFHEDVAGGPEVDLVLVDLTRRNGLGRGRGGLAELCAQDAFGQVDGHAVRAHVDQLAGEVGVGG